MNEYKFSVPEATSLLVNLLCSKLFLLAPADFTKTSGSGAVICVLFVFFVAFLFFHIYTKSNCTNILSRIKNHTVKKAFGIITSILLLFSGAVCLNLLVYFTKTASLSASPLSFITIPFAVSMLLGAISGIKSIGKLHGFFVPVLYVALIFLVASGYKSFDFTNLTPVFGKGISAVFGNGFFLLSNLFEILIFLFLPRHINGSFRRVGFLSLSISLVLYLVTVSAFVLTDGKTLDLPLFSVIQSGPFRRTDSAFLLLFSLSGMLYLSSLLYFSVHIFADTLKISDKKFLFMPFGLILISFSGISFFNQSGQKLLSFFSRLMWIVPFLLPLIFTFSRRDSHKKAD